MEKNNNTHLLYAGLAILVVIGIALAIPHLKKSAPAAPDTVAADLNAAATQTPASSADASLAAWNEHFQSYNGKIIVFGDDCAAIPATQTHAKGATVLLMNNSDTPHTVTVGGDTYTIGARHYKTTYLDTVGTLNVGCDARASASTIIVN